MEAWKVIFIFWSEELPKTLIKRDCYVSNAKMNLVC